MQVGKATTYLFKWAVGTISEKWKQVWSIIFSIKADLLFMVPLSLMMVSLEKLMEILKKNKGVNHEH